MLTLKKGQKKAKWPNHFISGKQFQKSQNCQIWPLKRPNGNLENNIKMK